MLEIVNFVFNEKNPKQNRSLKCRFQSSNQDSLFHLQEISKNQA